MFGNSKLNILEVEPKSKARNNNINAMFSEINRNKSQCLFTSRIIFKNKRISDFILISQKDEMNILSKNVSK
jgi:hypothetical protein